MKNILVLLICLIGFNVSAQSSLETFIDKYSDNEDFTTVTVSKKMFQMLGTVAAGEDELDPDIQQMIENLEGLQILQTDVNATQLFKEANTQLKSSAFEELMNVRDGKERVRILVRDSDGGNIVDELVILVGETSEFVLVNLVGKIDLTKIAKLAKKLDLDIDGLEHLKKIEED